jgi:hypothetical protein
MPASKRSLPVSLTKPRPEGKRVAENIRQEALDALATLAIEDPAFVVNAFDDLEYTLERYGFTLNEQEMEIVRDFQTRVRGSDEGIDELLRDPRVVFAKRWRKRFRPPD